MIIAAIPIDSRFSLYTKTGDLLPYACWLTLFFIAIFPSKKPHVQAPDN
jgi:hypothetical protein